MQGVQRKRSKHHLFILPGLILFFAAQAAALELDYDVEYDGRIIGSQKIVIEKNIRKGESVRLNAQSKMEAKTFLYTYRFEDRLSVLFEGGKVIEYVYQANDKGKKTEITAKSQGDRLSVEKKVDKQTTNLTISKDQYGLTSWSLFVDPALSFAPTEAQPHNLPVFILEEATIIKQIITKKNSEKIRAAGKDFLCIPVTWKKGSYLSQSWHATELKGLPVKYIMEDEGAKTTLWLKKW